MPRPSPCNLCMLLQLLQTSPTVRLPWQLLALHRIQGRLTLWLTADFSNTEQHLPQDIKDRRNWLFLSRCHSYLEWLLQQIMLASSLSIFCAVTWKCLIFVLYFMQRCNKCRLGSCLFDYVETGWSSTVPHCRLSMYGCRAFYHAGPTVWNYSLPDKLKKFWQLWWL